MPDETQQPNSEANSIPISPREPTTDAPIPPEASNSIETSLDKPESPTEAESAVPVKDDISANELLEPTPVAEIPNEPNNSSSAQGSGGTKPNVTVEKHGTDTIITEVMQPTAQMAGWGYPHDTTCAWC